MTNTFQELLNGMDKAVGTKTVVGDPIVIDGATIVPLIEVSFGMASGTFAKDAKESGAGGIGAKMEPVALLVVQNGITKLINVKNNDVLSKAVDLIPDLVNKITGKRIEPEVIEKAKKAAGDAEAVRE